MAYRDIETNMSDAQAVTVTADSTNIIDFQDAARDMGPGEPLYLVVQVGETDFAGGTSIAFDFETATDLAFTSPVDKIVIAAIATANLTAGTEVIKVRLPHGLLRFVRMEYTVVGTFTAGAINAYISKDVDSWKAFPDNTD